MTMLELTPRQTARVIEQAVRARVELEIEPRFLPHGATLRGRLLGRERGQLCLALETAPENCALIEFVGAFCEMRVYLADHLYSLTVPIQDVRPGGAGGMLLFPEPERIHVANRRRFERTVAHIAAKVRLRLSESDAAHVGLMTDIGPEGLGARLPGIGLNDHALVGDALRVSFELPGFAEEFDLPALICTKSVPQSRDELALGLQFYMLDADEADRAALARLQGALAQLITNNTDEPK